MLETYFATVFINEIQGLLTIRNWSRCTLTKWVVVPRPPKWGGDWPMGGRDGFGGSHLGRCIRRACVSVLATRFRMFSQ